MPSLVDAHVDVSSRSSRTVSASPRPHAAFVKYVMIVASFPA
jgi:hypothetical protein